MSEDEWLGRGRTTLMIGIAIALALGVRFGVPEAGMPEGSDPAAVRTGLAILAVTAVLWFSEALPLAVTALLVPVLAAFCGVLDVSSALASFAHPLIFLFFGGFALAAAMARHGLDRWIGFGAVRLGRGRFYPTAIALFLLTAVVSMWISNTATVAFLLPISLGVLGAIARADGSEVVGRVTPFVLLGIAYSASVGGIGTLIGTPPNAIAAAEMGWSFADWLRIGIPAIVILLPCLWLLLVAVCRPGKVPPLDFDAAPPRLGREAVATLVVFGATVLAWLLSRPLSGLLGIERSFDSLVAVAAIVALASLKLVGWREIERGTEWGVLLLFGGGLCLSQVLGQTGASLYLAERVLALSDGWAMLPLIGLLVLFVIFLTEVASNTATSALLVPIFAPVAAELGLAERTLVVPIAMAASCAFMLPVATPPNAIVFASGKLAQRQMIRTGLRLNLVFTVIVALIGVWLARSV